MLQKYSILVRSKTQINEKSNLGDNVIDFSWNKQFDYKLRLKSVKRVDIRKFSIRKLFSIK